MDKYKTSLIILQGIDFDLKENIPNYVTKYTLFFPIRISEKSKV